MSKEPVIFSISDVHLEFGDLPNDFEWPKADICILAGDIVLANKISKFSYKSFFKKVSELYKYVIYIAGNHEYYKNHIMYAELSIQKICDEFGIFFLQKRSITFEEFPDYKFIGATLWTDFFGGNPLEMLTASTWMNDFHVIKNFTVQKSLIEHRAHVEFIEKEIDCDQQVIVITHHAPSVRSIALKFIHDPLNSSFCSKLEYLMKDNVLVWIHGHMHTSFDYQIGNTRVICNPRGYYGIEENSNFSNKTFSPTQKSS